MWCLLSFSLLVWSEEGNFSCLDEIKLDLEVTFLARFNFYTKVGLCLRTLRLSGEFRLVPCAELAWPEAPPVPGSGLKLSDVYQDDEWGDCWLEVSGYWLLWWWF